MCQELLEGKYFYFTSYQLTDGISEKSGKRNLTYVPYFIYKRNCHYIQDQMEGVALKALLKKMNYVDAGCRTAARHSGPSVTAANGRNANGTKSNRMALPHLPLHPKVNWPIWTRVSVTRWLFHQCWKVIFCSSLYSPLNLKTMTLPRMGLLARSFTVHSDGRFAVGHLSFTEVAALHPKASPIKQHYWCKENINPQTRFGSKALLIITPMEV